LCGGYSTDDNKYGSLILLMEKSKSLRKLLGDVVHFIFTAKRQDGICVDFKGFSDQVHGCLDATGVIVFLNSNFY
jgi:hypothetical protein